MAIDEIRAKDLAAIEPPGSITKIADFAQQLSFGQQGLFAGVELPKPPISEHSLATQAVAAKIAAKPYAFFPGANGEGLDSLMSHHAIRPRDIQDFTKWLVHWNDARTQLAVVETPEQYFLRRATPQMIESFHAEPSVQRVLVDARRRSRVVEEELHETEVEQRRVRVRKIKEVRTVEDVEEVPRTVRTTVAKPGPGSEAAEPAPRAMRGHPRSEPAEAEYREYLKEEPAKVAVQSKAIAPIEPPPVTAQAFLASMSRGVLLSNVGFGSTAFGLIRGRADATAAFEAGLPDTQHAIVQPATMPYAPGTPAPPFPALHSQVAASRAVAGSPVAPYMPQAAVPIHHYPTPEVYVREVPVERGYPASPSATLRGAPPSPPPPPEFVLVDRREAAASGLRSVEGYRPPSSFARSAAAVAAATLMMPGFAAAGSFGLPGFQGIASGLFAGEVASRVASPIAGQAFNPIDALPSGGSMMPAGSLPRQDMFTTGMVEGASGQPLFRGIGGPEPAVRTPIPNNPLLGQITLVSPPLQVASEESERSGTAVSFGIRDIAKGAGALDAAGLSMLQKSLPPGAQAIYPALPAGSLGPQAVNMSLAPSLLSQILTQGYGPQAARATGSIASTAAAAIPIAGAVAPMRASIVPTVQRPTDATAGVLGGKAKSAVGSLEEAGAGAAGRGGALGFLGMPVRLAPSLGGSADVKGAVEARKVLPPGSAAILRPNEFAPLRNKVFPSMGTVNAEPDQSAWRRAAPSFGLRDAQPQTILSPDARIKPPHGGAPVPQIGAGGQTPAAKAISAASMVAPFVAAAKAGTAHPHPGPALSHVHHHAVPHVEHVHTPALPHAPKFHPQGASAIPFRPQPGPAAPSSFNYMPSFGGSVHPMIGMSRYSAPISAAPHFSMTGMPALPAAAASAASTSSRVASRFTPLHPSTGGGPSATIHDGVGTHQHHHLHHATAPIGYATSASRSGDIAMSQPGGAASPAIPAVRPSSSGPRLAAPAGSFSKPSMSRPAMPTTARGGGYSAPSIGPSAVPGSYAQPSASAGTASWMPASGIYSRMPEMPIATSIPARSSSQPATVIQRATHGGAVHANRTEHQNDTQEQTTNPQAQDPGAAAHEVNLLANEVWSLLKRKLLHESERLGKRY
ncbi:MAG TPA: hypothetical protein VHE55_05535 [Fimbriimonadaceae bacterium]|nr:hypothetical protein [Fimbriimonadaceae bacterium]